MGWRKASGGLSELCGPADQLSRRDHDEPRHGRVRERAEELGAVATLGDAGNDSAPRSLLWSSWNPLPVVVDACRGIGWVRRPTLRWFGAVISSPDRTTPRESEHDEQG